MLDEQGLEEAARLMLGCYGNDAHSEARSRLAVFEASDVQEHVSQWKGIIAAIDKLSKRPEASLLGSW